MIIIKCILYIDIILRILYKYYNLYFLLIKNDNIEMLYISINI